MPNTPGYWRRRREDAERRGVCVRCRKPGYPECPDCLHRRKLWRTLPRQAKVNGYTRQFVARCPNNDMPIAYTLQIITEGRLIPVEQIVLATEAIGSGYHEAIADQLHRQFGGRQKLVAHHHGVDIETTRT